MKKTWSLNRKCTSLEIIKYNSISDHKIKKSVKIEDNKFINRLMDDIEQIPADGDMMKSFGSEAEQIDLIFSGNNQVQILQLYEKKIKTPSTGFNSTKSDLEKKLSDDVETLLFPDFNKNIPKIKNVVLQFPDFSITFLGSEFNKGTTNNISYNKDKFLIKDKNTQQEIEIISGELSPQQIIIKVNDIEITIMTFQSKELYTLYPDYFQIIKL
ncbi:hypothetical protein [Flavobacterium sp. HNIBRBA15423]|uniref:hypothetical protein n=1 Tax=Flavobacterium sp. HNIBRBA15423 TaxID=3458683 RepID=UPI0040444469